jgi:hypothetical protein
MHTLEESSTFYQIRVGPGKTRSNLASQVLSFQAFPSPFRKKLNTKQWLDYAHTAIRTNRHMANYTWSKYIPLKHKSDVHERTVYEKSATYTFNRAVSFKFSSDFVFSRFIALQQTQMNQAGCPVELWNVWITRYTLKIPVNESQGYCNEI